MKKLKKVLPKKWALFALCAVSLVSWSFCVGKAYQVYQVTKIPRMLTRVKSTVVVITNVGIGSGAGIIMDPRGYILTCAHVVDSSNSLLVTLSNDLKISYRAKLVYVDRSKDLALIRINVPYLLPSMRVAAQLPYVGEDIFTLSHPLMNVWFADKSIVGKYDIMQDTLMVETTAIVHPGSSGGALVDIRGDLVGLIDSVLLSDRRSPFYSSAGMGLAVASSEIHNFFQNRHVNYLGIE